MLIREATAADIPGIASLVALYWQYEAIDGFERPRIEALLQRLLSRADLGGCWVAEHEKSLCGYLLAVFALSLEYGGMTAEIDEFFVAPDKRSSGAGTLLLQHAESALAARGVVKFQLQLATSNARSRVFYERRGFRRRAGYELFDKDARLPP